MKFAGKLGILPPPGPETKYRSSLYKFVQRSWARMKARVNASVIDLEEEAIEDLDKFLKNVDISNERLLKESFNNYFKKAEAKARIADALTVDPKDLLTSARKANVDLIKDISKVQRQKIQKALVELSDKALIDRIDEILGGTRNRARIIARDQTAKVHSELTDIRHQAAGAEEYIWVTAGDERVRPLHLGLNGTKYKYGQSTGAEGGSPPGRPILCRCIADPVL